MPEHRRAVIFANGVLDHPDFAHSLVQSDDLLVAADGGARLCRQLGLSPRILIGDFDSLEAGEVADFSAQGTEIIRHPQRKDFTDLELTLRHVRTLGIQDVVVIAALGARWDQTLANLLLPAADDLAGMRIRLVDGPQEMVLLRAGEELRLLGLPGDTVSLIPLGGDARGVTTENLEYPLHAETLYFGTTRGLSNVLIGEQARVQLDRGLLLCVVIHETETIDGGPWTTEK